MSKFAMPSQTFINDSRFHKVMQTVFQNCDSSSIKDDLRSTRRSAKSERVNFFQTVEQCFTNTSWNGRFYASELEFYAYHNRIVESSSNPTVDTLSVRSRAQKQTLKSVRMLLRPGRRPCPARILRRSHIPCQLGRGAGSCPDPFPTTSSVSIQLTELTICAYERQL